MPAPLKEQDTKEQKSAIIYVRVSSTIKNKLLKIAKKEDRPISTVIRWALVKYFA